MGERTVETNFYALDEELRKLRELANDLQPANPFVNEPAAMKVNDAADRLALVIHDLKSRAMQPADYVRDRTRIYRNSWINPLIDELLSKEK